MGLRDWFGRRAAPARDEAAALPAPPTDADILAALDRVDELLVTGHAPALVRSRVGRVERTIRATLPRLPDLGIGSADAYAVVATATDYLPEAVDGYLRLPRDWADTRPIDGGRTALMVLVDQLELLASTMDKMLDAATRADAQALIAHGRFLDAKFGRTADGGLLDVGGLTSATGPAGPAPAGPMAPMAHPDRPDQPARPAPAPPPTNSLDLDG